MPAVVAALAASCWDGGLDNNDGSGDEVSNMDLVKSLLTAGYTTDDG